MDQPQQKGYLWLGAGLALIVIAWAIGRRIRGNQRNPQDIPFQSEKPGSPVSTTDGRMIRALSTRLYEDLKGTKPLFWQRDTTAYQQAAALQENLLIALFNDFSDVYALGDGNLKTWILDDLFLEFSDVGKAAQQIVTRLNGLNVF